MMSNGIYVTPEGLAKLKQEMQERIDEKRPIIAERLEAAIKMGDLKENADYHAAKEDQAFNEGRIQDLQEMIHQAVIVEEREATGRVRVGNTVTIAEVGFEDEAETYRIVGPAEADPSLGIISNESPIARALIGRSVGDKISVATPGGQLEFKVIKIE